VDLGACTASDYVSLFFELFENSSDAIWVVRFDDGLILDVNDRFLSLFQLTREEAIGRTTVELHLWANPDEREVFVRALREDQRQRVLRYDLRVQTRWSEEFRMSVSEILVPWRGLEAILGIGKVTGTRLPLGTAAG
jgi:PAS domain S-box-containing protein